MPKATHTQSKHFQSGAITISLDLTKCPMALPEFAAHREAFFAAVKSGENPPLETITFSDKHGNVLRSIQEKVAVGLLEIPGANDQEREAFWKKCVENYERHQDKIKAAELTRHTPASPEYVAAADALKKDVEEFKALIDQLIVHPHLYLRELGDLFCDRGMQDLYMLHLFRHLKINQVEYEIILSNHDEVMLTQFESNHLFNQPDQVGNVIGKSADGLERSFKNLGKLLVHGVVTREEITSYIQCCVLQHLKMGSYDFEGAQSDADKETINVYFHTGVDLLIIKDLATQLKVMYCDETTEKLAETLENIQQAFFKIVQDNKLHELMQLSESNRNLLHALTFQDNMPVQPIIPGSPFLSAIWPRPEFVVSKASQLIRDIICEGILNARERLLLPENLPYHFRCILGHLGENFIIRDGVTLEPDTRFICTDTDFGKTAKDNVGSVTMYYCGENECVLRLVDAQAIERATSPLTKANSPLTRREKKRELQRQLNATREQSAVEAAKRKTDAEQMQQQQSMPQDDDGCCACLFPKKRQHGNEPVEPVRYDEYPTMY